jgi:hypothetical protein
MIMGATYRIQLHNCHGCHAWAPRSPLHHCCLHGCLVHNCTTVDGCHGWVPRTELLNCEHGSWVPRSHSHICLHVGGTLATSVQEPPNILPKDRILLGGREGKAPNTLDGQGKRIACVRCVGAHDHVLHTEECMGATFTITHLFAAPRPRRQINKCERGTLA